jgi:acyl-CoA synthetase (AMP-forming)/AMP-acid ligase II
MPPSDRSVLNLGRLLSDTAARFPDRVGLTRGDRHLTWREMDERVDSVAAWLRARGIGQGDAILVHSRNSVMMFESLWVAFKLGAIWVPTNFRLTPPEVSYIASTSDARVMFYDVGFDEHVDAAKDANERLQIVIAREGPREGEHAYEDLAGDRPSSPLIPAEVGYDDPLWYFYTSGTTGRPKAAVLTHGQMAFIVANHLADLVPGTTEDDASLVVAPLSHGAGIHMLTQVARGARNVLLASDTFDGEEAWRAVEQYRVSNMFTVPTILNMLVAHEAEAKFDHGSLRHVIYAGAPMYREDQRAALEKLGPVIVQYYGMGEVTGCITVLPAHMHSIEDDPDVPNQSCGYARTGMDIAVLGEDGRQKAAGETGELCVRGPGVFAGYLNDDEANAEAFRGGWFHTGDLGHLDERGFVYITGRASDMYISGGSNVYPREIEELLLTHPAVAEAAVVGVPDPKWGETGVAVVVLRDGAECDADALYAHLDGELARYKRPSRIEFWSELPRSAYGKIPKRMILELLEAQAQA